MVAMKGCGRQTALTCGYKEKEELGGRKGLNDLGRPMT